MPNPQNLVNWKPGQSGNPAGRPKGRRSFKTILNEILEQEIEVDDPITNKRTKKKIDECINIALAKKAVGGDLGAYQEIRDMVDGRVPPVKPESSDGAQKELSAQVYDIIKQNGHYKMKDSVGEDVEIVDVPDDDGSSVEVVH